MAFDIARLSVLVEANTMPAEANLARLGGMMGPGGALAVGLGAVAAAVVGISAVAVKMAGDFQAGVVSIETGAGESAKNVGLISDGMLKMAVDTGTTTKQLVAGLYMIESAGFHGASGLQILSDAAKGAKVGAADLGVVADATTTIMKDFGTTGITSAQAVNALIATVASGKTHMADLASAMAQILPTASAAHIGLNDVMGAMATMTGEGVPAANAATYLRQTILALDAPSAQTVKALASVGLSSTQVAAEMSKSLPTALKEIMDAVGKKFPASAALMRAEMLKVNAGTETMDQALQNVAAQGGPAYIAALKGIAGGSKQMQGILDLTGQHMTDFTGNVTSITDAVKKGGTSIQGWTLVQGTWNQKVSQAKEVAESLMIQLGTRLLPTLTQAGDVVAHDVIPAFAPLITQVKTQLMPALDGLYNELSPVLIPTLKWLAEVALAQVILGLKATIGILTFTAQSFTVTAQQIGNFMGVLGNAKDRVGDFLGLMGRGKDFLNTEFQAAIKGIGSTFSGVFGGLEGDVKPPLNAIIHGINTIISGLDGISIHIPSVGVGPVHTPGFDWNGMGIPQVPYLARGGDVSGLFHGAEAGAELLLSPGLYHAAQGSHVLNAKDTAALLAGGGGRAAPVGHTFIINGADHGSAMQIAREVTAQLRRRELLMAH